MFFVYIRRAVNQVRETRMQSDACVMFGGPFGERESAEQVAATALANQTTLDAVVMRAAQVKAAIEDVKLTHYEQDAARKAIRLADL